MTTSIYNGQFLGNILVLGRTNCGKTTFIEKLGLNNFFGNIVKTEWVSGIDIDKKREAEIQSYFKNETEVHIAQDQDKLDSLIDTFKQRSHENYDNYSNNKNVNSSFGENRKMDRLIIMDDVFGIADSHEKHCLTIDCGYLNKNGPGRYRSLANNPDRQLCYFNKPGDDVFYNTFISERIKEGEYSEGIYFKIEKVRDNNVKENFDAKRILEDSTGNARSDGIFAVSKPEQD